MRPSRVLVLTAEEGMLDDLLRLAAAAGCEADVARDISQVRVRWRSAPLVLLGTDRLAAALHARLPRRDAVLLVGHHGLAAQEWAMAVDIGAQHVLCLPAEEARLIDLLAETTERAAEPGRLIAVVGGQGGAGASMLAAVLALTAARLRERALLLDADPLGGGIDLLLGAEATTGLRWPDLAEASGRLSTQALHQALPRAGGVSVLAYARGRGAEPGPEAMLAVVHAGRRAGDIVVADLPRQLTPGSAAVAAAADLLLLVVPADVRASAAAGQVAAALATVTAAVSVVVRIRSAACMPPDAVAAVLELPLIGVLPHEPALARAVANGDPPAARGRGRTAALCRSLLAGGRSAARRRAA